MVPDMFLKHLLCWYLTVVHCLRSRKQKPVRKLTWELDRTLIISFEYSYESRMSKLIPALFLFFQEHGERENSTHKMGAKESNLKPSYPSSLLEQT